MKTPGTFYRMIPVLIFCLAASLLSQSVQVAKLDHLLLDSRMAATKTEVSGKVVFVAIDPASLDTIGEWPWPRSVHANLLDRMTESGAADVFFDIDFAFASRTKEDTEFVRALERAGGSTYLAVFAQDASANSTGSNRVISNLPYTPFFERSWPTAVNINYSSDGLVREYPYGSIVEGEFTSSPAALISTSLGDENSRVQINYSLDPDAVPTYSAADVLAGRVPANEFHDRSIIVGASALELRDNFSVPVHGVIPGALIHALAAETLIADAEPQWLRMSWVILFVALILGILQLQRHSTRSWYFVGVLILCLAGTEAVALASFSYAQIVVPSAILYPSFIGYGIWRLARSLDWSALRIRQGQVEIKNTRRVLNHVFKDSFDAIAVIDQDGYQLMTSHRAKQEFGSLPDGTVDLPDEIITMAQTAMELFADGVAWSDELREIELVQNDSTQFFQYTITPSSLAPTNGNNSDEGTKTIATVSARNVTIERVQRERITYLSNHDERTGAKRRGAFLDILSERLENADSVAVFALNLHRFKIVNATFGRSVGDALLSQVVKRIHDANLGLSPIARLDGDHFAVFTDTGMTKEQASALAGSLIEIVAKPYRLGDASAQINANIGLALYEKGQFRDASSLLAAAEEALDAARRFDGASVEVYNPEIAESMARSREIERAMWGAIDREEFSLLYQPQVRLTDGKLIGVEALARWHNSEVGRVPPDQFIAIAESNGFIIDLGHWVLEQSLRDANALPLDVSMAVNVSALQILREGFSNDVRTALTTIGVEASRLCVELTETSFVSSPDDVAQVMREIETFGATWALDDFGSGFSSMGYLSALPLQKIKLDKQFTLNLGDCTASLAILKSTSVLCKSLGIRLLCEGVETEKQAKVLLSEGCQEAQGYLYGKPQSIEDIRRIIANQTSFDSNPSIIAM